MYAVGLLLYRMLTGRLPWQAGTVTQMLRAHLYADPEPLPPVSGLPAEVAELCRRCLAKDPLQRPSSADLARRLADAVGMAVPMAVEQGGDDSSTAAKTVLPWVVTTDALPAPVRPRHSPAPRRIGPVVSIAVGLVAVTALLWLSAPLSDPLSGR